MRFSASLLLLFSVLSVLVGLSTASGQVRRLTYKIKASSQDVDNVEMTRDGMLAVMKLRLVTIGQVALVDQEAMAELEAAAATAVGELFEEADKAKFETGRRSGDGFPIVLGSDLPVEEERTAAAAQGIEYARLSLDQVLNHAVWRDAWQRVLNADQQAKVQAFWNERSRFDHAASVQNYIIHLDLVLNLSPDQHAALAEVIENVLAKLRGNGELICYERGMPCIKRKSGSRQRIKLEQEDVEPVLSEAQTAEFYRYFHSGTRGSMSGVINIVPSRVFLPKADGKVPKETPVKPVPRQADQ